MSATGQSTTVISRQLQLARALTVLLAQDLPGASWTIYLTAPDELVGQLDYGGSFADRQAALAQWADVLSATPEILRFEGSSQSGHGGVLQARTTHLGVRILVWVRLTVAEIDQLDAEHE